MTRILATGPSSNRRRRQSGVTLVELLVVMAIVAMLAGVAVLSAPPPRSDARKEADRFAADLDYAAQKAITQGLTLGLQASPNGYGFLRYDRGAWAPEADAKLGARVFSSDVSVGLDVTPPAKRNEPERQRPEDDARPRPNITFSPTGETTAFIVRFTQRRNSFAVSLDSAGNVQVSKADDEN